MRKLMDFVILWCLFCGIAFGQATNPQNTFANAVNVNKPSLWLNYNEPTAAFKDQISQDAFVNTESVTTTTTSTLSIGSNCTNAPAGGESSTGCTLTATAGDTIIVYVYPQGTAITSLTDSGGAVSSMITSAGGVSAWYFANVSAGSHTITVNLSVVTGYVVLQATDVAGAAHTAPIDTSSTNYTTASSTSWTSGSLTTTASSTEMLVGFLLGWSNTYTLTAPVFTAEPGAGWTGIFQAHYLTSSLGSYAFTGSMVNSTGYTALLVAVKPQVTTTTTVYTGMVTAQQPGFDSTNPANYSAGFSYNAFAASPNNTLGDIEWNVPWTMLLHVDRLNWDRTTPLVLASKGDMNSIYWKLFLQRNATNANASQLCFERAGSGANQLVCTGNGYDAMPNGFNYDIVVEDSGTGKGGGNEAGTPALSMWMNGSAVGGTGYLPGIAISNNYANGFGNVALAVATGGSGYAATTYFTSTGGGANCVVSGYATATSGVITSIQTATGYSNSGCTSNPAIVLTTPTGTGATFTATAGPSSMNSTTAPLMVPGYLSNGAYYGVGGTDTTQNPVYVDEFAIFPGNLTFGQITNLFYETKFYQGELFPSILAKPPLVIFEGNGCGPDFSGDQTVAMILGAAKAGIVHLIGMEDDDGNGNGISSLGWWRQMLDQAGLADVPLTNGTGSITVNTGGCPAANITAYNASTPQNPASYGSAATMYRTLFAKYPTTPIYVMLTQVYNGYNQFLASPADGISSLTGLQLQAQNAANGGWVSMFEGNFAIDTTDLYSVYTSNGVMPIYALGGYGAQGGPGILVSRMATDPLYMTTANMGGPADTISGYTNQNLAYLLSPYFSGGVTVATSGGTGYANATPFTSTGGGPYCHVTGIMTASGGVPNGIDTSYGLSFPSSTTYDGLGYGCTPATFTATGSGTNLTVSSVFGVITVGDTISGTGIPAGTTITGQTSGTTGGAGVYTTSVATTASAAAVTRTPTMVLTSPTGTGVTLTATPGIFLNNYGHGATNTWTVYPNQYDERSPTTAPVMSWFSNSLMDPPANGAPRVP